MAASPNDYFMKLGSSSALVNSPKVTSVRSSGVTTLAVDNCNWDTTTGKVFATYQVDTSNKVVAGTEIIWKGIVTGTTAIGSMTRLAGASDTGSSIGDIVELLPASAWANNLMTGILTEHNQDGTHKISQLLDTNGNEYIKLASTASAVNEVTVTNASTGNGPTLATTGGDTNADFNINSKGTGAVKINGARPWLYLSSASANADQVVTTIADLTSLTVTVTVPTGATTVRIMGYVKGGNTTADNVNNVYIFDGSTQLSADDGLTRSNASSGSLAYNPIYIGTVSAGSHTFKLRADNGGAGTFTTRASATSPAFISVECC